MDPNFHAHAGIIPNTREFTLGYLSQVEAVGICQPNPTYSTFFSHSISTRLHLQPFFFFLSK